MQLKTLTYTNPASAVAKNLDLGFVPSVIWINNKTDGGQYYWDENLGDGYVMDVDAGSIASSNGVTPLDQDAGFSSAVSGFTNANPGVISVADGSLFAAGDVVVVTGLADDQSASNSLNGEFTVASVSGNSLTTGTNTSAYSVYVSGGRCFKKQDSSGNHYPFDNAAVKGVQLGTSAVGGNDDVMTVVAFGPDPVL